MSEQKKGQQLLILWGRMIHNHQLFQPEDAVVTRRMLSGCCAGFLGAMRQQRARSEALVALLSAAVLPALFGAPLPLPSPPLLSVHT